MGALSSVVGASGSWATATPAPDAGAAVRVEAAGDDASAAEAERIVVGLAPGVRALAQEEVNALLVELGGRHAHVVRLKSGDPFVASRGGEEACA